jgi:hypothetical protein
MPGTAQFESPLPNYENPLAGDSVTPERIDQGVDYAGSGTLKAIARGVVTAVLGPANGTSSGWPGTGNFLEYQITQPGTLLGKFVYYAEGITPNVKVGDTLTPGQSIATIVPSSPTGIEIGYGSGIGSQSYASQHGGYTEGQLTAAGQAFSNLVKQLGGPAGLVEGRTAVGTAPNVDLKTPGAGALNTFGNVVSAPVTAAKSAVGAAEDAASLTADLVKFVNNPMPALLTVGLVALGAGLAFAGVKQMLGSQQESSP